MTERSRPVQLADSVWWIGAHEIHNQLHCNAYLIIDNGKAVIIDPGSVLDFEKEYRNISSMIDPQNISHIILHHQDPDLCSAVPLLEAKGIVRPIVTHWRSSVIIHYYGIRSPFYLVDRNNYEMQFSSGRMLRFLHTPYLHFPGAIITFDALTGILFSSDLFGAFYINENLQELFAGSLYIEAMKSFHEHYMPGNELLRPIMESLLNMQITMIAPQHGSIINDRIPLYIRTLRDLECGSFIRPIRKKRTKEQGYVEICNEVLRRCHGIAGIGITIAVFDGTCIILDPQSGFISDFSSSGEELWHNIFRIIERKQGIGWLSALEVQARTLSVEYEIPMPDVYESSLVTISRQAEHLDKRYREVKALSERLSHNIEETRDQLTRDTVSGLYNAQFFLQYLQNELHRNSARTGAFLLVSIDNLQRINFKYGSVQGDDVIRSCGMLIGERAGQSMMLARLEGAVFGMYMPDTPLTDAIEWAEKLRGAVGRSTMFIEPTTVSIGVVHASQTPESGSSPSELIHFFHATAGLRLRIARKKGADYVCAESSGNEWDETSGKVLLIDTEKVNIDILSTMLRQMDLAIESAADGEDALAKIDTFIPDIIISEVMVPKIDGFGIRERISESSRLKTKPFILVSHLKDEDTVCRAQQLGIVHYFKKPFFLSEVVGLVKTLIRTHGSS